MSVKAVIESAVNTGVEVESSVDQISDTTVSTSTTTTTDTTASGVSDSLAHLVTHNAICSQFPSINSTPSLMNGRRNERPTADQSRHCFDEPMNRIDGNKRYPIVSPSPTQTKRALSPDTDHRKVMKRSRHNFDDRQTQILETIFEMNTHYPDGHTIDGLALELQTPAHKIQIWFQNRRAKFRRGRNKSGHQIE